MDKPFKTIEEQIAILNSRGVRTDSKTAEILLRENYYAVVNGYKDLFLLRRGEDELYRPGTRFNEIYNLFLFDRRLRMMLFRYLAIAESTLKTATAYHFGQIYKGNQTAYLEIDTYSSDFSKGLIREFEAILGIKNEKRLKPYIAHYLENHGNVPIWVLMNYLSFGQATRFFVFQKEHVKAAIAETFGQLFRGSNGYEWKITHKTIRVCYDIIKDMRNICAHDERLYCARVSPGENVTFLGLVEALDIVLPCEESGNLRNDAINEIISILPRLSTVTHSSLLRKMGLRSLDDLLATQG
jgi:abortive infection bacteriophage resistance protein